MRWSEFGKDYCANRWEKRKERLAGEENIVLGEFASVTSKSIWLECCNAKKPSQGLVEVNKDVCDGMSRRDIHYGAPNNDRKQ